MKSDVKVLVGKRVKSLRKGSRLTQEQLAEKANLHAKYISSLECGRENPTLDVFFKISKALGVEVADIFAFEHENGNAKELKKTLTALLNDANPEKLQMAFKIVKAVIK